MNFLRISYDEFGVATTIAPATSENAAYTDLLRELAGPYQLALLIGKMSEEAADKVLAEVYAKTIVTDYEDLDEEGWKEWFLSHPGEFKETIHVAEHPDLWEDMCNGK